MRRSDHILVYYDPTDNRTHCRVCSVIHVSGDGICESCVKQYHRDYRCCSYSNPSDGQWNEHFKFDNTKHKILVSTNGCNLIPNCNKECTLRNGLKELYKKMINVTER